MHSHASRNETDGIAGFDIGGPEESYFLHGPAGYHALWDSRLYDYSRWETLRFLLSNVRFWLEEYRLDGFRFDGVTSMLYQHHGIARSFSGSYNEYFGFDTNVDACVYLMLANSVVARAGAASIAEDVSGMPTLSRPVAEAGLGFTARLAMGLPDFFTKLLTGGKRDEDWAMLSFVSALCQRRYSEKTIAYVECHDQVREGLSCRNGPRPLDGLCGEAAAEGCGLSPRLEPALNRDYPFPARSRSWGTRRWPSGSWMRRCIQACLF